jgi:predicted dehydrogenase
VCPAIAAGKHVYTEKPAAGSLDGAVQLARAARAAGVVHGVVQDKLLLPGVIKLRRLVNDGFFGRVLSVRLEFGYWVFEGDGIAAQRPSWNYRKEQGGGIVLDMFPHWQYLLEDLFGPVTALYSRHATHIPVRWDEKGSRHDVTAEDAAYALLEFDSGAVAAVNSSRAVRVNRRELVELQVDGTAGIVVADLRHCAVQRGRHAGAGVEPGPARSGRLPGAGRRIEVNAGMGRAGQPDRGNRAGPLRRPTGMSQGPVPQSLVSLAKGAVIRASCGPKSTSTATSPSTPMTLPRP